MKLSRLFFVFVMSMQLQAQEVVWKYGNVFINLFNDKETNLIYSKSCKESSCEALSKTNKINWNDLKDDSLLGGKNPGAVLCKEVLNSDIIFLKDLSGNESTFCLFKDKSVISSSSLSVIANQNSNQKSNKKKKNEKQ